MTARRSITGNGRRSALAIAFLAGMAGCGRRDAPTGCLGIAGQRVRWIVPYSPGGGYDILSRLLEGPYQRAIGAEIVIDNEPGGGGLLAATQLRDARPDGRTLAIISTPGLLAAGLTSTETYPNPIRDFDIIGRLERREGVIVTGSGSGLRTMNDALARQADRRLLVGITGIASSNLVVWAVAGPLLGLEPDYLAGYPGSREEILGAMRGEVDMISVTFESIQDAVEAGDLRVMMQLSNGPISDHPALAGSAWLGGRDGWVARRAPRAGYPMEDADGDGQALVDFLGAGTVVAAPRGVPTAVLACLRAGFQKAAQAPEFLSAVAAARRSLDVAGAEEARAGLVAAEASLRRVAPAVRAALKQVRQGGRRGTPVGPAGVERIR